MEVILSAIILGGIFTELPWKEYFLHPDFYAYFLNMFGYIHYTLPSVFLSNAVPEAINQQLWTIPYELYCYIILIFLHLTRCFEGRRWVFFILLIVFLQLQIPSLSYNIRAFVVPGLSLIMSFIIGVLFYKYRDKIPYRIDFFILSAGLMIIALSFPGTLEIASPIFACYTCVYLGLLNPKKISIVSSGDYSYGMYLYGYAIQQAVMAVLLDFKPDWYINLIISLPLAFLLAIFSWHCVEKPILRLKAYL